MIPKLNLVLNLLHLIQISFPKRILEKQLCQLVNLCFEFKSSRYDKIEDLEWTNKSHPTE